MVEGPQCRLKTLKLAAVLLQRRLLRIEAAQAASALSGAAAAALLQRCVQEVFSVGKECFLVFEGGAALRLHFAMSGNSLINSATDKAEQQQPPPPSPPPPPLVLVFDTHRIALVNGATATVRTAAYVQTVRARAARDVLALPFDTEAAVGLLRGDTRAVLDAIMDQAVAPGVGNVIKCEGLLAAGIHPLTPTAELEDQTLRRLLGALRAFARAWYLSCRAGRRHDYAVYGRQTCAHCGTGRVQLVRCGDKQRITYFCDGCQRQGRRANCLPKPKVGSLRCAWQQQRQRQQQCAETVAAGGAMEPATSCRKRSRSDCDDPKPAASAATATAATTMVTAAAVPAVGKGGEGAGAGGRGTRRIPLMQPMCKCRPAAAKLQRVRKTGPNQHRLFWSCGSRNSRARCSFFVWADGAFPRCSAHNAPATMRRVLKVGANNGRYFFSCRETGCQLVFKWATEPPSNSTQSFYSGQLPL